MGSLSVDAACSGNPGIMEYQGVLTSNKKLILELTQDKAAMAKIIADYSASVNYVTSNIEEASQDIADKGKFQSPCKAVTIDGRDNRFVTLGVAHRHFKR